MPTSNQSIISHAIQTKVRRTKSLPHAAWHYQNHILRNLLHHILQPFRLLRNQLSPYSSTLCRIRIYYPIRLQQRDHDLRILLVSVIMFILAHIISPQPSLCLPNIIQDSKSNHSMISKNSSAHLINLKNQLLTRLWVGIYRSHLKQLRVCISATFTFLLSSGQNICIQLR